MSEYVSKYRIVRNSQGWEALYRGVSLGTFPTRSSALEALSTKMYEEM